MENWLIIILALIVLLAILDGVRRAIVKQRAAMKESRDLSRAMQRDTYDDNKDILSTPQRVKQAPVGDEGEYLDPEEEEKRRQIAEELPGTVRVVQRRALEEALQVNRLVQQNFQTSCEPIKGDTEKYNQPQQASLNLEEQVPTLMDSVSGDEQRREPELDESESLKVLSEVNESEQAGPVSRNTEPPNKQSSDPQQKNAAEGRMRSAEKSTEKSPVEEVLIINIMAPEGDYFEGNDLLRVLLSVGMRFGDMNIFHYHDGGGADGPVIFSLANMVVPGVFDLGQMEEFITPGVSLFLALPIEGEAIKAFEILLSVSREIAEQLGGKLKDENRSVFTAQTAEHYRQRVMEYQRRKALARAQI